MRETWWFIRYYALKVAKALVIASAIGIVTALVVTLLVFVSGCDKKPQPKQSTTLCGIKDGELIYCTQPEITESPS